MVHGSLRNILISSAVALGAVALVAGQAATNAALKNPAGLKETAPAKYTADFDTSAGMFKIEVTRAWAPSPSSPINLIARAKPRARLSPNCGLLAVIKSRLN